MSIVDEIFRNHERLLIVIGSADKSRTEENPWDVQEREKIIRMSIPMELQERLDIAALDDVPDDDVWCENLKRTITHDEHITLFTGNDWVREICIRHKIQTSWIAAYRVDISGTKIREMLQKGEDVS